MCVHERYASLYCLPGDNSVGIEHEQIFGDNFLDIVGNEYLIVIELYLALV